MCHVLRAHERRWYLQTDEVQNRQGARRHRIGALPLVLVLLAGLLAWRLFTQLGGESGPAPVTPSSESAQPSASAGSGSGATGAFSSPIDSLVGRSLERLPLRGGLWPTTTIDITTSRYPGLSKAPISRAVGVFEPFAEAGIKPTVLVQGVDGQLRRLDVVSLSSPTEEAGNQTSVVNADTLDGSGRFMAFPQRDVVVVVDLADNQVRRINVPGFNTNVAWIGDRLAVADEVTWKLIDVSKGSWTSLPVPPSARLVSSQTDLTPASLYAIREATPAGPATIEVIPNASPVPIQGRASRTLRMVEEFPASGGRVALTGITPGVDMGANEEGSVVHVVDLSNATTARSLVLCAPRRDVRDCGAVRGWLDERSVLVWVYGQRAHQFLRWDMRDGSVSRVVTLNGQVAGVSLRPRGALRSTS